MFSLLKKTEPATNQTVADHPRRVVRPRTDIHEEAHAVVLTIEVPGCDDQAVNITGEQGTLIVRATPQKTGCSSVDSPCRTRSTRPPPPLKSNRACSPCACPRPRKPVLAASR